MTHEGKRRASGGFRAGVFGATPIFGAMAGLISLTSGCAVDGTSTTDEGNEQVAATEQGISTCITVQNTVTPPSTTAVDDAQLVTDATDPTKANTNFGTVQQMIVGYNGTGYQRLLFKFDLAGAGVPAGSTIDSATLHVRMIQSPGKAPVDIFAATALWNEATVTWNSFAAAPGGGLGALETSFATNGVANNSTMNIPLSNATVATWINPATNYGLVFDHSLAGRTTIGSSEAPAIGPRPKLDICYTAPTCSDGIMNGTEAGVDCGGSCPNSCSFCFGKPDGTACDDGNACTPTDTCQGGSCVGRTDSTDANTCAAAGTYNIAPGGSTAVSGILDADGDDFYSFAFTSVPAPGSYYHPKIDLTNDAGGMYTLYIEQSCGAGFECGSSLNTFEMLYPQNPNDCQLYGNCTDNTAKPTQWVVRVAPSASAPVCSSYTVTASNI